MDPILILSWLAAIFTACLMLFGIFVMAITAIWIIWSVDWRVIKHRRKE